MIAYLAGMDEVALASMEQLIALEDGEAFGLESKLSVLRNRLGRTDQ
ncbi:MAG: hypothetical protein LR015_01045 [Verrucomicrobia bacterium]|nr:hypothetical protein [Verrucomicrobiota bacterium]